MRTKDDPVERQALAEHATQIRALGRRAVGDLIEIGRRLTECKRVLGHGNWLPWLHREFGWSERTAQGFMGAHKLAQENPKYENFAHLNLPISGLYLLSAPSTPPEVRDEILDRAERGEKIKHVDVRRAVVGARPPAKRRTEQQKRAARRAAPSVVAVPEKHKPPAPIIASSVNSEPQVGDAPAPAQASQGEPAGELAQLHARLGELADKLDPLLEGLFVEGATKNMATTRSPSTVAYLAAKIERLLVHYGVMRESRRSSDPQGYASVLRAKATKDFNRQFGEYQPTAETGAPAPTSAPTDDGPDLPSCLRRPCDAVPTDATGVPTDEPADQQNHN